MGRIIMPDEVLGGGTSYRTKIPTELLNLAITMCVKRNNTSLDFKNDFYNESTSLFLAGNNKDSFDVIAVHEDGKMSFYNIKTDIQLSRVSEVTSISKKNLSENSLPLYKELKSYVKDILRGHEETPSLKQ